MFKQHKYSQQNTYSKKNYFVGIVFCLYTFQFKNNLLPQRYEIG